MSILVAATALVAGWEFLAVLLLLAERGQPYPRAFDKIRAASAVRAPG